MDINDNIDNSQGAENLESTDSVNGTEITENDLSDAPNTIDSSDNNGDTAAQASPDAAPEKNEAEQADSESSSQSSEENGNTTGATYTPGGYSNQYSYDYTVNHAPTKKNNQTLKVILIVAAVLAFWVILIGGLLMVSMYNINTNPGETVIETATPGATVTPDGTLNPSPTVTPTVPSYDEHIKFNGESGWINPGDIVSDDAIVQATYKVIDTVVAITTESVSYSSFYGDYVSKGAGSGVIFAENTNEKGEVTSTYIITNNHVVDGATDIKVTLSNGETLQAKLVGKDSQTDIAVIEINASGLPIAKLGDSDKVLRGEKVIVIGNPLGTLASTVTTGVVSAPEREIEIDGVVMKLMQTDAAVNPGNSGGGMFNLNGELIAVINAKSTGEDVEGLGFAIPVNTAKEISTDLIEAGYVKNRPQIGVLGNLVTKDNYNAYRQDTIYNTIKDFYFANNKEIVEGFYITDDSSVKYATLDGEKFNYGDVISEINGTRITNTSMIAVLLAEHEIGDDITVTVMRVAKKGLSTEIVSVDVVITISENQGTVTPET